MIEKILPNLYKIEIPLPRNPLKALNCYVFKDKERNLIVDTGFDREECRQKRFSHRGSEKCHRKASWFSLWCQKFS